ncbi:Short-chain dehydrogenase/reductase SDR [Penicillium sp. DV-2018c]|nr:Short-chain dehydrogenase/reductase SDR [Penicillium sp. DV-2018c]
MPIPIIATGLREGISSIPYAWEILRIAPWVLALAALKYYFEGARNGSERMMRSKVIMVTGGTSGIGAEVVRELATRGAQRIHRRPPRSHEKPLIYAEQVDLSSLHSIRTFATKWIDNIPPRRLDSIILAGGTVEPSSTRPLTTDGIDPEWQINYLANFHLLSILSPALRAQPAHRDVRVIFATCSSYIGAEFSKLDSVARGKQTVMRKRNKTTPGLYAAPKGAYALSKLALTIFAHSFQRHLNAYTRPDGLPPCTRVIVVDPGLTRTPGMRRWLTGGSLWGSLGGGGGWLVKECREMDYARMDVGNDEVGKRLWEFSERMVEEAEKESAVIRALERKEREGEKVKADAEKTKTKKDAGLDKGKADGSRRSRKGQNK